MPSQKKNIANYFAALIVIATFSVIYTSVAQDLLEAPEVVIVSPRPPTENLHLKSSLADLFPEDAWQRGDCSRLLTSSGALLFQEWKQTSEDQWTLHPVTIISGRGMSKDGVDSPIILTANEGAEVQFAESFDLMGSTAPPIKMGRMIGDVTIERVNVKSKKQAMKVLTRNVRITNEKIWTTDAIHMNLGSAQLRGRDLTIFLAASATTAANSEDPSSILDRLTLVYLDELFIPLDDFSEASSKRPQRIGESTPNNESRGVVTIHAQGAVDYDFSYDRLSLRDEVVMKRVLQPSAKAKRNDQHINALSDGYRDAAGHPGLDVFKCETLDLSLRNPSDRSIKREHALDWIESVSATGSPASLELSSQGFALSAEEIEFDGIDGLLRASASTGVNLRRGDLEARFKSITYQYNPDFPDVIGSLDAEGFGLVTSANPDWPVRQIQWTDGFLLQSDGKTTVNLIETKQLQNKLKLDVYGDIRAELADGVFNAGEIHAIFKPVWTDVPEDSRVTQAASDGVLLPPTVTMKRKLSFVPDSVNARNAVSLVSNLVDAQTDDLLLYFEQGVDFLSKLAPSNSADSQNTAASNPSLLAGIMQPGGTQPSGTKPHNASSLHAPVARPRPVLRGEQIVAKLLMTQSGIQAKDLSITDNVHVTHQINVGNRPMPVELVGQTMRLQQATLGQGDGQDYLQIGSGPESPAKLMMGDGFFVGPMIKVWPRENFIQVAGTGELKVPTQLLQEPQPSQDPQPLKEPPNSPNAAVAKSGLASKIAWTMSPHCRWNGGMQFDGQSALLSGGVNIDARLISNSQPWVASISGDEMAIELSAPIALSDPSSLRTSTLARISVVQVSETPVKVLAEQYQNDGSPQGRHLLSAGQLTFLPDDGGKILGSGPGWYRGWIMNERSGSLLSNASRPDRDRTHPVLQGIHLTFRETLQGDLDQQTLKFTGGVRAGARPLDRWDEEVDVTQMQRLDTDEMTLDCGELQFGITPGMPADLRAIPGMPTPWEMSASGGIVVRTQQESGLIEGQADRASFESKKSSLVIYGTATESAAIRRTAPDGRPGHILRFPQVSLNLKTYELEGQMEGAQLQNLPIPVGR